MTAPRQLLFALALIASVTGGCSNNEPSKDQHLSRANDHFAAGKFNEAAAEYRAALRITPTDPVASRGLGISYHEQGKLREAYPLLLQSAQRDPNDIEVQVKLASTYLNGGARQQARGSSLLVLEKQPGHEEALMLLTESANTQTEIEETEKLIGELREKDVERSAYHVALGYLYMRRNDQARAEAEFKRAQELEPQSAAVHFAFGNLYRSQNKLTEAEQAFKTAADLSPPRSVQRLRYADFKLQTGAVGEAKAILEEVTRHAPDYLPARVYSMRIVCGEKLDENCAGLIQHVLSEDPANYDALFLSGRLSLAKGDAANAIRVFEPLRDAFPRNAELRYQLALAYLRNSTDAAAVDNAVKNLEVAVEVNPRFAQAVLLLSELRVRSGRPTGVVEMLSQLLRERPQIAQAYALLATAHLMQRDQSQALAVYRQMASLFPKDARAFLGMGLLLSAQGQQREAREAFETVLGISPTSLPAVEKLVDLDLAEKNYPAALDRVQKLIDNDPKDASPWALRAKVYLAQRDFARAEPDLLKAIELNPDEQGAYILLAGLYVATSRQEEAVKRLTAFTEKNKDPTALLQLAALQEQLKNVEGVRDTYEKLLTVNPRSWIALNNLAVQYSERLGNIDRAHDLARRAREIAPDQPAVADTLGWILFKKGNYAAAAPLLKESATRVPDNPEIQFHLGMAQYYLGEEEAALAALQNAAASSEAFPSQDEARRRLAILKIKSADPGARGHLESHLREHSNDPVALVRLAELQERDGAVDDALKTYEGIVTAHPHFSPAIRRLARLYGQREVVSEQAFDVVLKARQADPDNPELAKILGVLNYRKGFYPQSLELLQRAAAARDNDPELLFFLGMSHYQLKHMDEAKSNLERALSINLEAGLAQEARRVLADCCQDKK